MKKSIMSVGAIAMSIAVFSGCNSTSSIEERQQVYNDFIVGSRAAEVIATTGNKSIDSLASSSSIIYKNTGVSIREYIELRRGNQTVYEMSRYLNMNPNASAKEITEKANGIITKELSEVERKEINAENLIAQGKEQVSFDNFLYYKEELKKAEDKVAFKNKNYTDEIKKGAAVYAKRYGNTDWNAKIKELEKAGKDVAKVGENIAVLLQDITQKIQVKANDIANLAQDPTMQNFITETATLQAQKTFASEAKAKEIDAQIDAISQSAKYKPIMDKKAQYEKELEQLKKDNAVLVDGVGSQVAFSSKALPWLINQMVDMQSYGTEE